ncbi:hypothetical protein T484DRAFT_3184261 [Baffinella frigidus]|nr:hypothetical protein T484DRAFT_3184261 [Cryptophyta sp. CCMP2293]
MVLLWHTARLHKAAQGSLSLSLHARARAPEYPPHPPPPPSLAENLTFVEELLGIVLALSHLLGDLGQPGVLDGSLDLVHGLVIVVGDVVHLVPAEAGGRRGAERLPEELLGGVIAGVVLVESQVLIQVVAGLAPVALAGAALLHRASPLGLCERVRRGEQLPPGQGPRGQGHPPKMRTKYFKMHKRGGNCARERGWSLPTVKRSVLELWRVARLGARPVAVLERVMMAEVR